jgi:hypothetical protein
MEKTVAGHQSEEYADMLRCLSQRVYGVQADGQMLYMGADALYARTVFLAVSRDEAITEIYLFVDGMALMHAGPRYS